MWSGHVVVAHRCAPRPQAPPPSPPPSPSPLPPPSPPSPPAPASLTTFGSFSLRLAQATCEHLRRTCMAAGAPPRQCRATSFAHMASRLCCARPPPHPRPSTPAPAPAQGLPAWTMAAVAWALSSRSAPAARGPPARLFPQAGVRLSALSSATESPPSASAQARRGAGQVSGTCPLRLRAAAAAGGCWPMMT